MFPSDAPDTVISPVYLIGSLNPRFVGPADIHKVDGPIIDLIQHLSAELETLFNILSRQKLSSVL